MHADGDHGVGRGEFPVGADVCRGIEELSGNLVEHLSLEGYALGQDNVESRDAVGCYHNEFVVYEINVAHFTVIHARLAGEVEIRFC